MSKRKRPPPPGAPWWWPGEQLKLFELEPVQEQLPLNSAACGCKDARITKRRRRRPPVDPERAA
jgi:hypothetical protein